MSSILITTLGKARKSDNGRYREITYRFADGFTYTSSFFLLALLKYREKLQQAPEHILIMGTASSMWDALLEMTPMDNTALAEKLLAETDAGAVQPETLSELSKELSAVLGYDISCQLIPLGRDAAEQAGILRIMAAETPEKASVCLDVTHGLRILPLLELLAVIYLQQVRQAQVSDLFYGAADLARENDGIAPVIRLDYVLQLFKWLSTLPIADETGRYDALAELMTGRPELAQALRAHSLHLRTNQTIAAQESAENIVALLEEPFADPVAELYRPILQGKFNWRKGDDLASWQILSARSALRAGDFLRCVILLREARVSLALPPGQQSNQAARDKKLSELNRETDRTDELLNEIRNCLAHASSPETRSAISRDVQQLLQNENRLRDVLNGIADDLYKRHKEYRS
ncbi:MAG: TIGR02221 family CRISPR-associated protein [Lentisphaerae bacterium]|nr:TIGR02221 family CRISPR-associated protein [Lentisphaerota bacterium]